ESFVATTACAARAWCIGATLSQRATVPAGFVVHAATASPMTIAMCLGMAHGRRSAATEGRRTRQRLRAGGEAARVRDERSGSRAGDVRTLAATRRVRSLGTTLLSETVTPSSIVRQLDEYVIGQDDAKRTVAVAVYTHFRKIA